MNNKRYKFISVQCYSTHGYRTNTYCTSVYSTGAAAKSEKSLKYLMLCVPGTALFMSAAARNTGTCRAATAAPVAFPSSPDSHQRRRRPRPVT